MGVYRTVAFSVAIWGDGSSTSMTVDLHRHMELYNNPFTFDRGTGNAVYPVVPSAVLSATWGGGSITSTVLNGQYLTINFSSAPPASANAVGLVLGF